MEKSTLESPVNGDHADESDAKSGLRNLRLKNLGRVIVGYLNINSIRNKLDALKEILSKNIDILMVAETKLDASFPKEQFFIEGYSDPLRLDRNDCGGGLLAYVRSDISSNQLKSFKFDDDIVSMF